MRNVEKIADYLRLYPVRCVIIISFIVLFVVGIGGYYVGQQSTSRDADIQRVQTVERQLTNAGAELDEATAENQTARRIVDDSAVINQRITESVDRSQSANTRTADAVEQAQSIVRNASATADENAKLIADSQRIIENARIRFEKGTSGGEKK